MDHLPLLSSPSFTPSRIPCICLQQDYDGRGLDGFPERVGWTIDLEYGPTRIENKKSTINSPAALLQLWLYFGALHEVLRICGQEVALDKYVQADSVGNYVTSAPLRNDLDDARMRAADTSENLRYAKQKLVRDCLNIVFRFFLRYHPAPYRTNRWDVSSVLSPDLSTSIIVLAETLANAALQIWPLPHSPSRSKEVESFVSWNPLHQRLLERNWCPSEVKMLYQEVDKTGLYLASLLRRPLSENLNHRKCSEGLCLALQISDDDYESKHTDACLRGSTCVKISIDQDYLSRILLGGGLPILHMSVSPESGNLSIQVVNHKTQPLDFIAISHVWAHGLGNPKENALPSCQITRLKELCSYSTSNVGKLPALWIDTLCIPVAVPEARKAAILLLSTTFRFAQRVLVLDADLQRSSKDCSRTELAVRVMCSGWMRRLWTLQETVMAEKSAEARKVMIWFREGALFLNDIGGKNVNSLCNTEDALWKLFSSIPQYMSRTRTFNALMSALRYRTTSKKEDEALCIASILGYDQQQIKAIAAEDTAEARMQKFYTFISEIPASVLFNKSIKLGNRGFGWAPMSLMGSESYLDFLSGDAAKCDVEGLHVKCAGYIATGQTTLLLASDTQNQIFFGGSEIGAYPRCKIGPQHTNSVLSYGISSTKFKEVFKTAKIPAVIINPRNASESALVSVIEQKGDTVYASFLMKVYTRLWRQGTTFDETEFMLRNWRDTYVHAREFGPDQHWCVR